MAARDINIDNTPLSEKIAETIRNNILKGVMKPGERLVEPKLSEMLGISRTPIREALRLLESEGFIEIIPRRGAVVTEITPKDVDDIFILKMKLESLAASLATGRMDDADLKRLHEIADKIRRGSPKGYPQLVTWNAEFHNVFIHKCGNERLIKMLEGLQLQYKRATAYSFSELGRVRSVDEEHDLIIKAFEDGDSEKAGKLVSEHVQNGWEFIRSRLAEKIERLHS